MNFIKKAFAKVVAALKAEPVVAGGGVTGIVAALVTWQQTNQITTLRQLVTLGAPIVISFLVRVFVTPNVHVALTVKQLHALQAIQLPAGMNVQPGATPPNYDAR